MRIEEGQLKALFNIYQEARDRQIDIGDQCSKLGMRCPRKFFLSSIQKIYISDLEEGNECIYVKANISYKRSEESKESNLNSWRQWWHGK